MAHPVIVFWDIPDVEAICAVQDTTGPSNLIINGNLVNPEITVNPYVKLNGISRSIVIASNGVNFSNNNFTITGTYRGAPISETIVGPQGGEGVETNSLFESVSTVFVDGALVGISVGTGDRGEINWILLDNFVPVFLVGVAIIVIADVPSYTVEVTYQNPLVNEPLASEIFQPFDTLKNVDTTQFLTIGYPFRAMRVLVGGNGSLTFNMIQQGIR